MKDFIIQRLRTLSPTPQGKFWSVLVMLLAMSTTALGGGGGNSSTYYSKMTVTAKGATGAGTVYVATNNQGTPAASAYGAEKSATNTNGSQGNQTYYMYAKASAGATFHGWYTNANCTGTSALTNANGQQASVNATSTNQNSPSTGQYYAKFTYKYYSKLNVSAVGNGTVSVNTTNTAGNAQTASQNSDDSMNASEDQTYYVFAQAGEGAEFAGWYTDAACTQVATLNGNAYSVTATGTNAGAATTVTLYAKFTQNVTFTSTVTVATAGDGAGTVSVSETNTPGSETSATHTGDNTTALSEAHTYYLFATPAAGSTFMGWYSDEACTQLVTTEANCTRTVTANNPNGTTEATFYAKFAQLKTLYSRFVVTTKGTGMGTATVNTANTPGTSAIAEQNSEPTLADSEAHTYYLFATPGANSYFAGWYSDEACTQLVTMEANSSRTVTATSSSQSAPTESQLYALFNARENYTFTVQVNTPANITSIKGGDSSCSQMLNYSAAGSQNISNEAPEYHLQVEAIANVLYTVKVYDSSDNLVATPLNGVVGTQTCTIASSALEGGRIEVETSAGYPFTVKVDTPANITSINGGSTAYKETLEFSAAGTEHTATYAGNVYNVKIVGGYNVYYSVKIYNSSNTLVSEPLHLVQETQTCQINRDDLMNGRIEVTTQYVDDDDAYFILKADPTYFPNIQGGSYNGGYVYTDNLNYSVQGELNLIADPTKQYYIKPTLAANVCYDYARYAPGASTSEASSAGLTTAGNHMVYQSGKNGRTMELIGTELIAAGTEWTMTVIGNPDHFNLQDSKANKAPITPSLEGATYTSTQQFFYPQIQAKDASAVVDAYFFQAGANINDKSQAYTQLEGIVFTNTTSWKTLLTKYQFPNTIAAGGTLLIESAVGVGQGSVTVNIEGTPSQVTYLKDGATSATTFNSASTTIQLDGSKTLTFAHRTNTNQLYRVFHNGEQVKELTDGSGANLVYSYKASRVKNGDVFTVKVDFPAEYFPVDIQVPAGCEGFIQSVKVNNNTVAWTNGTPLSVKGGSKLEVTGTDNGYYVKKVVVNGVEKPSSTTYALPAVSDTTTVFFDVMSLDRNKHFTIKVGSGGEAGMTTALNQKQTFAANSNTTVAFCDADNDIQLTITSNSQSENDALHPIWKVNGVVFEQENSLIRRTMQDGDLIEVDYTTTAASTYGITYRVNSKSNLSIFPEVKIDGTAVDANHQASAGQTITIQSNEDFYVTGVTVNDVALTAADGVYSFQVAEESTVNILGVENYVTLRVNGTLETEGYDVWGNPGMVPTLYATYDGEPLEFEAGVSLKLRYVEGAELVIWPNTSTDYEIKNVSYTANGSNLSTDDYTDGIAYVIPTVVGSSVIVNVGQKVRDKEIQFYVAGLNEATGRTCSISDNLRSMALLSSEGSRRLSDNGWHTIKFCDSDLPICFQLEGVQSDNVTIHFFRKGADDSGYTELIPLTEEGVEKKGIYEVAAEEGDELRLLVVTPDIDGSGKVSISDLTKAIQSLMPVEEGQQPMPLCTEADLQLILNAIKTAPVSTTND